jgi:hypothetical protein
MRDCENVGFCVGFITVMLFSQALSQKPESRAARASPRDTIFRRVALTGISCDSRLHQWIGNFEELIVAFPESAIVFPVHSTIFDGVI